MNSREPGFDWHVNGLYVALGPDNGVYTDTAATTGHGARAALLTHTNKPWSKLQEMGYSIQGYVQPAPSEVPGATYQVWGQDAGEWYDVPFEQYARCNPKWRRLTPQLVDVPDLPIVAEHIVTADEAPTAVNLIDRAVDALLRARAINTTMHARFPCDVPSYRDCRSIDDEIHNALAALGQ